MSLNTVKAVIICNAWSTEARAKAAAARKRKGGKTVDDLHSHFKDAMSRSIKSQYGSDRQKRLSNLAGAARDRIVKLHGGKVIGSGKVKASHLKGAKSAVTVAGESLHNPVKIGSAVHGTDSSGKKVKYHINQIYGVAHHPKKGKK